MLCDVTAAALAGGWRSQASATVTHSPVNASIMRDAADQQILARTIDAPRESEPPTAPAPGAFPQDNGPSPPPIPIRP
jgi:hypothetical protein